MDRVRRRLKDDRPLTWLFYGDSITHGATHTFGWRDYSQLFAERVRHEAGRPMDIVINSAINGDDTRGLLRGFGWRVARFSPDVVFIMIGMNDCSDDYPADLEEFGRNLDELVDKVTAVGGLPVLQTACTLLPGQGGTRALHLPDYMETIRARAAAHELPLIDHTALWQDAGNSPGLWMSNAFHPNAYGHRVLARTIFGELDLWDPTNSHTCRLTIP